MKSWYQIKAQESNKITIQIYDEIGAWGVTAQDFIDDLGGFGASVDVDLYLNTGGGSVFDGMAMYNALKSVTGSVNVYVVGLAASMGSAIAMAGDRVHMYDTTIMMVHKPHMPSFGNADDHRAAVDLLDKVEGSLIAVYANKTGISRGDIEDMLRQVTWMTAEDALEKGFIDEILEPQDVDMQIAACINQDLWDNAPKNIKKILNENAGFGADAGQVSASADTDKQLAAKKEFVVADNPSAVAGDFIASKEEGKKMPDKTKPTEAKVDVEKIEAKATADSQARVDGIMLAFDAHDTHSKLMMACIKDPDCSVSTAKDKLLAAIGKGASPATSPVAIATIRDEQENRVEGMSQAILIRAGIGKFDGNNEFTGFTLKEMARACLEARGIPTRGMNPQRLVGAAFTQSTSDFPVILENVMHKTLLAAYQTTPDTWRRFCKIGSVSDFRAHSRYRLGSIGNLDDLNEQGEFENKTIPDGEKETISATTKGNLVGLSRQTVINDDLGALTDIMTDLGRAAARTIESGVYAHLAANAALQDSVALFHADHDNIGTGGVPTTDSFGEARNLMASQMDISGNDFLDIAPSIFLGGLAAGTTAREVNDAQYNTGVGGGSTTKNNTVPNTSRGMFSEIIDTARISGTAWYAFADPSVSPVMEVVFLNGEQSPYMELQNGFNVDGATYKVRHDFGIGSVDFRGAVMNAGA